MKNILFVMSLVLLVGCAGSGRSLKFSASPRFLIAGQSNSVSPAQGHPWYYSQTGRVTLNDYYNGNAMRIPTASDPMQGSISWIYLGDYLNRDVTFMNVGVGGTSTKKWNDYLYLRITEQLEQGEFDALLWVQGESDIGEHFSEEETYSNMVSIINKTRAVKHNLVWFVAINSMKPDLKNNSVRRAQLRVIEQGYALRGPDLDVIRENPEWVETSGAEYVGEGLREHGRLWFEILSNHF